MGYSINGRRLNQRTEGTEGSAIKKPFDKEAVLI